MTSTPTLADLLRQFMTATPYPLTPGLLGKLSGLPKSTIINWLDGRAARPRRWEDVLRVADVLRLDEASANALLRASGHPSIAELRDQSTGTQSVLFRLWPRIVPPAPIDHILTGVPTPSTPLIDRAEALLQLYQLLQRPDVRLVTLTGVGGAGKTRLAIQATLDMQSVFADGVFFVPLAALTDAQLVVPTIAHALGLMPTAGTSLLDQLRTTARTRRLLVVLDNVEHLQAAATDIATLLAELPLMRMLVTSRVRLHVDGEHLFEVPPLTIPALTASIPTLLQNPAVALFVQRARAADPDFAINSANARVIAEICAKLEGLPLSIELAAARVKLLTPNGVLARLGNRLNLLRWGSHSLLQRHRTLRETLNWSYTLLTPAAQVLFRRLAVFMGGCTVEAIEAVASLSSGADTDTLDALMILTDSSLIQVNTQDEPRYLMLETLREYAAEQLTASGEGHTLRQRHATYYLQFVETAEPLLAGPEQVTWLKRLHTERDNIRAALGTALSQDDTETAGRIAASLRLYWITRGYLDEGRRWLTLALVNPKPIPPALYAKMLLVSSRLARQQSDLGLAEAHAHQSLARYRDLNDQLGIASALGVLGVITYDQGQFASARLFHQESLDLRRSLNDMWGIAATLTNLGEITRHQGDLAGSRALHDQSLRYFRALDDAHGIALALTNLGLVLLESGATDQAASQLEESLILWHQLGEQVDSAECLEGLAGVAVDHGDHLRAAQLWGAVAALRSMTGAVVSPVDLARFADARRRMAERCDPSALQMADEAGRAMTLDQAVALALSNDDRETLLQPH